MRMADNEKRIAIVYGDDVYDVAIRPGTSADDILTTIGAIGDVWLADRQGQPLGPDQDIYISVVDGEKLVATPACGGVG
jgi:hypothetical protein